MSEVVFDEMRRGRLTADEARAILVTVARRHAAKLELIATVDRALETPEPMSGEHADRMSGSFYRGMAAALFHSAAEWSAGFPEYFSRVYCCGVRVCPCCAGAAPGSHSR